ncbi:hypothetical protein KIPB_008085, partial [Kipferlia bialata]
LCLPTCIAMTSGSIYNVVDSIFIGKYTGTVGLAAFATVVPLETLLPIALPYALEYGRVVFLWSPLGYFLTTATGSLLRVENRAGFAMVRQVTASVLNMLCDPILMSVLGLGIAGAAYSTSLSMVSVGIAMLLYFFHPKAVTALRPDLKVLLKGVDWHIIHSILSIGVGMWIAKLPPTVGAIIGNVQIRQYSDTETEGNVLVAALGVFSQVSTLVFMPMTGIINVLLLALGISGCIVLICLIFATGVVGMFTDDPAVLEKGAPIRRICVCIAWVQAFPQIATIHAQVHRQVHINLWLQLLKPLLAIILVYALPPFMGVMGIWLSYPLADAVSGVFGLIHLRRYMKIISNREALDIEEGTSSLALVGDGASCVEEVPEGSSIQGGCPCDTPCVEGSDNERSLSIGC